MMKLYSEFYKVLSFSKIYFLFTIGKEQMQIVEPWIQVKTLTSVFPPNLHPLLPVFMCMLGGGSASLVVKALPLL